MTTDKKPAIAEAVSAATDQLIASLKAGKSEELTRYIKAMSIFHSYSFSNTMMIICQRPDATRVAGFQAWKALGRNVRKGESGIMIMAPAMSKKRKDEDGIALVGDDKTTSHMYFRPVYVFDEAQTEGDALPDLRANHVEGDATVHLARLVKHVAASGITLEYGDAMMQADGVSHGGRIVLKPGMTEAETLSVLVHELAHERLHKNDRRKNTTKKVRETEAEAVAHVVCSSLGFATNGASETYIGLYEGDADLLMASLSLIQKTATDILVAIADPVKQETNDAGLQEPASALPLAA
jgi:antirestriction protein ArdC